MSSIEDFDKQLKSTVIIAWFLLGILAVVLIGIGVNNFIDCMAIPETNFWMCAS